MANNDNGFGMGLFCGTIVGALGVYMAVTPEGKQLKDRLLQELKLFQEQRPDHPELCQQKLQSLRSFLHQLQETLQATHQDVPKEKLAKTEVATPKKKHIFKALDKHS